MTRNKLAFIIATKDRLNEIRRVLESLCAQSRKPDQVIVVDGGLNPVEAAVMEFPELSPTYLKTSKPSAARQRNLGLSAVDDGITLVGFLDDDVVLDHEAVKEMMTFWDEAPVQIGGAAFNLANHPPLQAKHLKALPISKRMGLYSHEKGRVLPSGFQTMIGWISKNSYVDWLCSGAVVWRRTVFDAFRFDEWFQGYSYLEDLDFSYRVGRSFRLAVVSGARYYHFPAPMGRGSGRVFGKREVLNRIYFVRKNRELSLPKCVLALGVRMGMSLAAGIRGGKPYDLLRTWGNLQGIFLAMTKGPFRRLG